MIYDEKIKKMLAIPIVLYFLYVIVSSWLNYDGYSIYTTVFFIILLLFLYFHFYIDKKNILTYLISIIIIFIYIKQLIYNFKLLSEITSNNNVVFHLMISAYIVGYLVVDFLQMLISKLNT